MRKRYKHNLSYFRLLSCDGGELVPCGLLEVLPGDTVQGMTSTFVRVSPLVTPVMHLVDIRIHHWYIPHRLVWDEWEDFITGGPDGVSTPLHPTIDLGDVAVGSLADYLGIPHGTVPPVSALPFRAYARVWNEWYRDEDLQSEIPLSTASGPDSTTNTALQLICWSKDYFTTARPWEQKGSGVTIPIGDKAPVVGIGPADGVGATSRSYWETDKTTATTGPASQTIYAATETTGNPGSGNKAQIYADLAAVTGIDISDLREALALQRFQEARARYGSRYSE